MCSSWDRWGSRPVVWSTGRSSRCMQRVLCPPSVKYSGPSLTEMASHLSVSLPTVPGSETAVLLLLSRRTLKKGTFTNSPLSSDSEKQPGDYLATQTRIQEIWFMRASKNVRERERDRKGRTSTFSPSLKASWSPTMWILWRLLRRSWQSILNWIPNLGQHLVR